MKEIKSEIVRKLIDRMREKGVWFTTETDPVICLGEFYTLDKYGYPTEKAEKQIEKEIKDKVGDGAVDIDEAIDNFIGEAIIDKNTIDYVENLVTKFENEPVISDEIGAYTNYRYANFNTRKNRYKRNFILESRKKLNEENTKSRETIDNIINDTKFDANSNEGKIIMRTNNIFNILSKANYDVTVSIDNGETTSSISIDNQNAQVLITVTNADQELRAYTTGTFEITDENIKTIQDIKNIIKDL